jgi:predicted nucleic acid-binding protein
MAPKVNAIARGARPARPMERSAKEVEPVVATRQELIAAAVRSKLSEPKRTFLDTNILLCAEDASETRKREIAIRLIVDHKRSRTGVVSLQVLQEFFVNATKKLGLDPAIARRKVEFHSRFDVVQPSITDVFAAIDLHRLRAISYWDALIVHCAKQAGCRELLTEDMQHSQVIEGVRIVNPFL